MTVSDGFSRRFSVAPMLDWTDRHFRFFARLLSRRALLYTEMVTTGAVLHGDREHLLGFDAAEHPLALQLGGSEPLDLARCARIAQEFGYDEINLNVGCPSDRVQRGTFGACLMATPERVAEAVDALRGACALPVTVKHRIGIDHQDEYEDLERFVTTVKAAGCSTFIVHARKAWLQGLSPKENRDVPPLDYARVYRLKREHPQLEIIINGGITTLAQSLEHLQQVDGVMIGREAYHNPMLLAQVDALLFGDEAPPLQPLQLVEALIDYAEDCRARGVKLNHVTRHLHGLFHGLPGAKHWRRTLSEEAWKDGAGTEVLRAAVPPPWPQASAMETKE